MVVSVRDLDANDLKNKRVFLRVDFNVPLSDSGIEDATRILQSLPTIDWLLSCGAKLIIASHLGRPNGRYFSDLSMRVVVDYLKDNGYPNLAFSNQLAWPEMKKEVDKLLTSHNMVILENIRFHKEEMTADESFSKHLASMADIFVQDAFGVSHREHASVVMVPKYIPGYAGLLLLQELTMFSTVLESSRRPLCAILGGAKMSTKIDVIEHLISKVDVLFIGGAMVFTFLKAKGINCGSSLVEESKLSLAKELLIMFENCHATVVFPFDQVIESTISGESKVVDILSIPEGWRGVDIGPQTIAKLKDIIDDAQTIIWNGPMGLYEVLEFSQGTFELARSISESLAVTVVGGGDSVAALKIYGLESGVNYVSTGGGASLFLLKGQELSGVQVLTHE